MVGVVGLDKRQELGQRGLCVRKQRRVRDEAGENQICGTDWGKG